ncbi:MAG: class I SAM-dependent methyltransferase, partial [Ekhidna sp.]
ERVLDVGSGLGHIARLFKRNAKKATVIGIERDEVQIKSACKHHDHDVFPVNYLQGDIQKLKLVDDLTESFDVVHSRFLLEHINKPLKAIQTMVQLTRPGGQIILADDDHSIFRVFPEISGFELLWKAYEKSYINRGNDPYIGKKLVHLLQKAGIKPVRNGFTFFGGCAGSLRFEGTVRNLGEVLRGAREAILDTNMLSDSDLIDTLTNIEIWSKNNNSSIWYPINYAVGVKPISQSV